MDSSRLCTLLGLLLFAVLAFTGAAHAQVNYVTRFKLDKKTYLKGEPIFVDFLVQNTGTKTLLFSYRFPTRATNRELEQEPDFTIKDPDGHAPRDPAPHPCGGARGSAVYGSVTLPPGSAHTERWLLNQWARFTKPGKYSLRARRRLPLKSVNAATNAVSPKPVAYALALDELSFEIDPASSAELDKVFEPYGRELASPGSKGFPEAFLVATTLPRLEFLPRLTELARASIKEHRWDREQAMEGLARLGTRAAWNAILEIARDKDVEESQRAYAILLLGERADPAFLTPLLRWLPSAPDSLRDDILRALGFFNNPRANQVLFKQLHSKRTSDRVNAILGLRNLEIKDAIPAILAMLDDPDDQVRQVANFGLQSMTGQKFDQPAGKSSKDAKALAASWHQWWQKHEAGFVPLR